MTNGNFPPEYPTETPADPPNPPDGPKAPPSGPSEPPQPQKRKWVVRFLLNIFFWLIIIIGLEEVFFRGGLPRLLGMIGFLLVDFVAFLFAAWQLAKADIFFTFLALGEIKTVDRGEGNLIRVLANINDHHVENMEIVPGAPARTFLERVFGLYWIGIPPAKIHEFEFVHERLNPNIKKDTPSSDWIKRDPTPKKTKVLLWEIPHTFLILGVEFKDGFKADLLFDSRSRVVKPYIATYLRKGNFIDYTSQYVEAGNIEALRQMDYPKFLTESKKEGSKLALKIIDNIDSTRVGVTGLPEAVGLTMVAGFISRFEASDKTNEIALAARMKAELEGLARIEAAKQDAERATQEALRDQRRAEGEMAGLKVALGIIKEKTPGVDDATALHEATTLSVATKYTRPDSPVIAIGAGITSVEAPRR